MESEVKYLKCFFLKFQKFFKMLTVLVLTADLTSIYQMGIKNRKIYYPQEMFDRYLFQYKSSCRIAPKNLTWFVSLIFWPLSQKLLCLMIVLFLGLNIIISFLLAFKESLLALTHSTVRFRSLLTFLFNCLSQFLTTRRFVSPANWWIELHLKSTLSVPFFHFKQ